MVIWKKLDGIIMLLLHWEKKKYFNEHCRFESFWPDENQSRLGLRPAVVGTLFADFIKAEYYYSF